MKNYTIPCTSAFSASIQALAAAAKATPSDLARSVLMLCPSETIARVPDPGPPAADDRETVTLQSGKRAGKPMRRKPRLQLRLQDGLDHRIIRRALALARSLASHEQSVRIVDPGFPQDTTALLDERNAQSERLAALERAHTDLRQDAAILRTAIGVLSPRILPDGVRTRFDASYVLGLPPGPRPPVADIKNRFRQLSQIHHPDRPSGDQAQRAQLLDAYKALL